MRRRQWLIGGATLGAIVAGACWFGRGASADVPTAAVERGTFVDAVQIRGEIKAGRSVTIIAPADAGELRILKLAKNGSTVKAGDVLIEFDGTTVARTAAEKRSELRGFDAEFEQATFDAHAKDEENLTTQSKAHYDRERARLDYSAKDVLSRVEAEQRGLAVDDADQKLKEASAKLGSDRVGATARQAGVEAKREKSKLDLNKADRQTHALVVRAPSDGIVTILRNWKSGNWMNPQEFKEGDRAWAGASIAELPDISSLFGTARVDEIERGRLAVGQSVSVRVEAMPDRELKGRIVSISALAKADFTSWPPPRNFDVTVALDDHDERLRPGMTANLRVATETVAGALMVPPQAVFSAENGDVVYVVSHGRVERRHVEVDRRNADHVLIRTGVAESERVAMKEPQEARQ
jgi:RND family efflux transporter MFP subunit